MKGAGCSLSRDLSRSALQIPSVKISDAKDTHSIMRRTRPNAFADAESLGICCYEVLSISTLLWISLRVWIQCPLRLLWRRRRDEEALFFRMKWSWALSSDSGWREMNVTTSVLGKGTGLVQQGCRNKAPRLGGMKQCLLILKSWNRGAVQAMLPLKAPKGGMPPWPLTRLWWWPAIFGFSWFVETSFWSLPLLSHGIFSHGCLCTVFLLWRFLGLSFSLIRTPVVELKSTQLQYTLIFTNYICKDPIFRSGHIQKSWVVMSFLGTPFKLVHLLVASSFHRSCSTEKRNQFSGIMHPNGNPFWVRCKYKARFFHVVGWRPQVNMASWRWLFILGHLGRFFKPYFFEYKIDSFDIS